MPYVPVPTPVDPGDLTRYLASELRRLSNIIKELEARIKALEP